MVELKKNEKNFSEDEIKARSKRFKLLRGMLGLNKGEIAAQLGYSRASISYWENATFGGLTFHGAMKLVDFVQARGIHCNLDWLLKGVGAPPYFQEQPQKPAQQLIDKISRPIALQANLNNDFDLRTPEIQFFKEQFDDTIVLNLEHSAMKPYFLAGHIVGGVWALPQFPVRESYNGIVEVHGKLQVRRIKQGAHADTVDLYFTSNDPTSQLEHEMNDVHVEKIARIIRVWAK